MFPGHLAGQESVRRCGDDAKKKWKAGKRKAETEGRPRKGAWSAEFRIVGSICLFVEFTGADDVAPETELYCLGS